MRHRRVVGAAVVAGLWAAVAAALLNGCNLPTSASDAGAEAAAPQTWGDQCAAVFGTLCNYYINTCGGTVSQADCVNADLSMCCVGTMCNAASTQAPSQVTICQQDIIAEDCNSIVNNVIPPDCVPFTSQNPM